MPADAPPPRQRRRSSSRRGLTEVPDSGPLPVDVPGVVSGWDALLTRFGTRSLQQALAPAIAYARDGFPVAELMAAEWDGAVERLAADPAAARTFLPGGKPPAMGEIFQNPRLADSLALIAEHGKDAFYSGADRPGHRRRHAIARRPAHRRRLRRAHGGLGRDHQHDLPRRRRARDAAEHAGRRRARDAEHPRGLRHHGDGPQLGRPPPRGERSQEDRVRRSRRLPGRPRLGARRRAGDAAVEGLRRRATPRHRHGQGRHLRGRRAGWRSEPRRSTSPAATAAIPSTSPPPTVRATSSRSSSRCSAASAPASSPATPASRCTTAAPASP